MSYKFGQKIVYKSTLEEIPLHLQSSVHGFCKDLLGKTGEIIAISGPDHYGIQFDSPRSILRLHGCGGYGKYGYCYWVKEQLFDPFVEKYYEYEEML